MAVCFAVTCCSSKVFRFDKSKEYQGIHVKKEAIDLSKELKFVFIQHVIGDTYNQLLDLLEQKTVVNTFLVDGLVSSPSTQNDECSKIKMNHIKSRNRFQKHRNCLKKTKTLTINQCNSCGKYYECLRGYCLLSFFSPIFSPIFLTM